MSTPGATHLVREIRACAVAEAVGMAAAAAAARIDCRPNRAWCPVCSAPGRRRNTGWVTGGWSR